MCSLGNFFQKIINMYTPLLGELEYMPTKRKSRLGVKLFVLKLCKQTYFMYLVCTRLILSFFAISFLLARIFVLKSDDSYYAKRMSMPANSMHNQTENT